MLKKQTYKLEQKIPSTDCTDLVYHFGFIDGIQIQQILIALENGYKLKSIAQSNGIVEFVLRKGE